MIASSILVPTGPAAIIGWVVAILVASYTVTAFRTWYRLRHIPGPWLASFSYLWMVINTLRGRNDVAYLGLRKYGSLVRNGPNYLVTDDPEVLRRMAAARSKYSRDGWYAAAKWYPEVETMASMLDTAEHDKFKAKTAAGYSGRENPDLEVAVDSQVNRLVSLIRRKHLSNGEDLNATDFAPLSRYFTLDVITRLGMSQPFGYLDEGEDIFGYAKTVDDMVKKISFSMEIPLARSFLLSPFVFKIIGPKTTDKEGLGKVMGYVPQPTCPRKDMADLTLDRVTKKAIAERYEKDAKPRDDMFVGSIRPPLPGAWPTDHVISGRLHAPRPHPTGARERSHAANPGRVRYDGVHNPRYATVHPGDAAGVQPAQGRDRDGHRAEDGVEPHQELRSHQAAVPASRHLGGVQDKMPSTLRPLQTRAARWRHH